MNQGIITQWPLGAGTRMWLIKEALSLLSSPSRWNNIRGCLAGRSVYSLLTLIFQRHCAVCLCIWHPHWEKCQAKKTARMLSDTFSGASCDSCVHIWLRKEAGFHCVPERRKTDSCGYLCSKTDSCGYLPSTKSFLGNLYLFTLLLLKLQSTIAAFNPSEGKPDYHIISFLWLNKWLASRGGCF